MNCAEIVFPFPQWKVAVQGQPTSAGAAFCRSTKSCRERKAEGASPAPGQDAFPGRGPHRTLVKHLARRIRQMGGCPSAWCTERTVHTGYAAGSWRRKRRVVARLEATTRGFDPRYIVTSPRRLTPPPLRGDILRARTGGKPDQAAQGPARLRPHLLPEPARQPVPAGAPHRRLLADARAPRRGVAQDAARLVRVRHPPPEIAQEPAPDPFRGRRSGDREGRPRPYSLRLGLSRRRSVPHAGGSPRHLGTLTAGAMCPANPRPFNPQPRYRKPQTPTPQKPLNVCPCVLEINR